MSLFYSQLKAVTWRNYQLKKANKAKTFQEIFIPLYLVLILYFVKFALKSQYFDETDGVQSIDIKNFMPNYPEDVVVGFVLPEENNSDEIISMVMGNKVFADTKIQPQKFENDEAMVTYNTKGDKPLIAGVIFENNYLNYTIRINGTSIVDPKTNPIGKYGDSRASNITSADTYLTNFIPLQIAIDQAIINLKTQTNDFELTSAFGKLSKPAIVYVTGGGVGTKLFALYMTFIFVMHIALIVTYIVTEKEKKKKEGMLMAGVHPVIFWLSWEIIYFVIIAITSLVIAIFYAVTKTFQSINIFILFLTIFVYGISNCSIGFMVSTLFKKANTAGTVSSFIITFLSLAYFGISFMGDDFKLLKTILSIFFSPVAMGLAMEEINYAEDYNQKISFNNIFSGEFGKYFLILIINNILYFVLTLILDEFFDSKTHKDLWSRKKTKSIEDDDDESKTYFKDIQEDPKVHEKCMVEVTNISKKFKRMKEEENDDNDDESGKKKGFLARFKKSKQSKNTFLAVNDVSFKVYQNEIFAILGHNGAGKTTLIQLMVGLLKSDYGTTYYEGSDVDKNLNAVRRDFGVCSQNNILYDELTVEDHIKIFAGIKGVKPNIKEILEEIDLTNQKDSKVIALSGGQKRKLCIGLAIIGNPKYIFLDEPTTGLDPLSRRKIWDLLLSKKKNRVIFLTTHYMDEADILADRKLILNKGKIRCLGSSLYLKSHFKMKYNLYVETNDKDGVSDIIYKNVPEASYFCDKTELISRKEENDESNVICHSWKLPISSTKNFAPLMDELELYKQREDNFVKTFALYMPSLEELFIRLEDEVSHEYQPNDNEVEEDNTLLLKNYEELPKLKRVEKPSTIQTLICLIKYRMKVFFKNKSFASNAILLPVFFSIFTFVFIDLLMKTQNVKFEPKTLSINEMYKDTLWNYDIVESNFNNTLTEGLIDGVFSNSEITYHSNEEMNNLGKKVDKEPYYVASFSGNQLNNKFSLNVHYNDSMPHVLPVTINTLSNAILASKNITEKINVQSYPYSYTEINVVPAIMLIAGIYIGIALSSGISNFGPLVVRERSQKLLKQLQLNGVSRKNYWLSALTTDTLLYVFSCYLIIICGLIYGIEAFRNILIIVILLISMLIWSAGSMLFQYIIGFMFNKEETAYSFMPIVNIIPSYIGIIVFTIINSINISYDLEVIFSTPAIIFEIIITLICPSYGIMGILCSIFTMQAYHSAINFELNLVNFLRFNSGITPLFITMIISIIIYFFLLVRLDQKLNKTNASDINTHSDEILSANEDIIAKGDDDVYKEFNRVKNGYNKIPICVKQISKEYKVKTPDNNYEKEKAKNNTNHTYGQVHLSEFNKKKFVKTAVEDVSFGINDQECFGLLGPNGAGKSTLLNIVTATIPQTTGDVYFNGVKTHETDLTNISLGYCPQNDTLWKELSLREHIEMFLRIRGYSSEDSTMYAKQYIKSCGLEEHQNKRSSKLSGGTKRKLSLLIAICGSPKQVMLDEPTAGMDPSTRRFVWNIIKDVIQSNKTALIMTTHSMEEAENLCTRIGILINGRLICIGSPEHLKLKFGDGYILEVQSNDIDRFHKEVIEGTNILGTDYTFEKQSDDHAKYEVKIKYGLGRIFEVMERSKDMNLIEDYNFSQTSLEQIFINFAKLQIVNESEN